MSGVTTNRTMQVRGPLLADGSPLWTGAFDVAFAQVPPVSEPIGDLVRNAAVRVLAQDSDTTKLGGSFETTFVDPGTGKPKETKVNLNVRFHDPRLLQAAVKPDNDNPFGKNQLQIAGSIPVQVLPIRSDGSYNGGKLAPDHTAVPFADIRIVPAGAGKSTGAGLSDWPQKSSRQIEYPRMALVGGVIPFGIWHGTSTRIAERLGMVWSPPPTASAKLFGELCELEVRSFAKIKYIPALLTPDGIELDVVMKAGNALPGLETITGGRAYTLRVRLEPNPAAFGNAKPRPPLYRLVLIGGADAGALRSDYDRLMALFAPADTPLFIDTAPGHAPVHWLLQDDGKRLSHPGASTGLDPLRIRTSVRTARPRGSEVPAVAVVLPEVVTVSRKPGNAATVLDLSCGKAPTGRTTALHVKWGSGPGAPTSSVSVGSIAKDTGGATAPKWEAFDATADTAELRAILPARYAAAGVLPAAPADTTYAFVPLDRGHLQLRLPSAEEVDAVEANAGQAPKPASVFAGFLRCVIGTGPEEQSPSVEVGSAVRFAVRVAVDISTSKLDGAVLCTGAQGRLAGTLWAADGSPSPAEILPGFESGPAALRTVPIVFGAQPVAGWPLTVSPINNAVPAQIVFRFPLRVPSVGSTAVTPDAVAWRCHPQLPLVAAIAMTRTSASATRPSSLRDLVPFRIDSDSGKSRTVTLLRSPNGGLPTIQMTGAEGTLDWPWPGPAKSEDGLSADEAPEAGVSLVPVTLPGVEFSKTGEAFDFATLSHSLRFDLPILGELFAGAALKRSVGSPEPAADSAPTGPNDAPTALDPAALVRVWQRAGDRLALTRTLLDRVTPWGANSAASVKVTTLAEPLEWNADFNIFPVDPNRLPLGRFVLAGETYTSGKALAGLTRDFAVNGKQLTVPDPGNPVSVEVTGFAVRLRREMHRTAGGPDAPHHVDTRGFAVQSAPAGETSGFSWRSGGLTDGTLRRYFSTGSPIPLTLSDAVAPVGLHLRDLPMGASTPGWVFDGLAGIEGALGPTGKAFARAEFPRAVHEWRFIGGDSRFAIRIGPLRFRPLRLARVELEEIVPGKLAPTLVRVIGTIASPSAIAPDNLEAGDLPQDEQAYLSGNLVMLEFTESGGALRLSAVKGCIVKGGAIATASEARVTLRGAADVVYGAADVSDEDRGLPFSLAFELGLKPGAGLPVLQGRKTVFTASLFGNRVAVPMVDIDLSGDNLTTDGVKAADTLTQSRIVTEGLKLTWATADAHARLALDAAAILVPTAKESKSRAFVTLKLSGLLSWFDLAIGLHRKAWRIDHASGTIDAMIKGDWNKPAGHLIRGLPLPAGTVEGTALLAVAELAEAKTWPDFPLSAGVLEFVYREAAGKLTPPDVTATPAEEPLSIVQRILGKTTPKSGSKPTWRSTILLSASRKVVTSRIKWPVHAVPDGALPDGEFAPDEKTVEDWVRKIAIAGGTTPLLHSVTLWIKDAELPVELISAPPGSPERPFTLNEPWRFRAFARHVLNNGTLKPLEWNSIDEVSIVDLDSLKASLAGAEPTYAFAARYVDRSPPALVKGAGIVERAFARAGILTRELVEAVKTGPAVAQLLISGGAVSDLTTVPASTSAPAECVTLVLPWLDGWQKGADLGALHEIRQAPDAAAASVPITISSYDAASGRARLLYTPAAPLGVANGSLPLIERTLTATFGGDALKSSMPVDQAFIDAPLPVGVNWHERPIYVRALIALKRVVAARPYGGPVEAATVFATATRPGVSRALIPRVSDDAKATATSVTDELIVLSRNNVETVAIGQLADNVPGDRLGYLALLAFGKSDVPLALAVARIADPRGGQRDMSLHESWRSVERPAFLKNPQESRPLREDSQTVYASPALGWPAGYSSGDAVGLQLHLGDERPIQDHRHAWAGRARTLSAPARGWSVGTEPGVVAAFLALGRRVLFRRPGSAGFRAPPDRSLTPLTPRARAPLPRPIRNAIQENLASDSPFAPLIPGRFEIVDTGVRPGVLTMQHEGFMFTRGTRGFDPENDRFGRPADRGPVVFHQIRYPRSTVFPDDDRAQNLALRRRTFVAEDQLFGGRLSPSKVFRGPAAVLRYQDESVSRPDSAGKIVCTILRVISPELGRLSKSWDGSLRLEASLANPIDPRLELVRAGLLLSRAIAGAGPLLRAELQIGAERFRFITVASANVGNLNEHPRRVEVVLALIGSNSQGSEVGADQLAGAKRALGAATADTPIALILRLAPISKSWTGPIPSGPDPIAEGDDREFPGEQRVLRFRLPHLPADRLWLPVETATLVFGDPAYDRRLASRAATISGKLKEDRLLLAADRSEYDTGETIYFAVGRLASASAVDRERFKADGSIWEIRLGLRPKPDASGNPRPQIPLRVSGIATAGDGFTAAVKAAQTAAIPISALRDESGLPAAIEPGDRIVLMASLKDEQSSAMSLDLGIVPDPVIPPAEAVYSLVTLDGRSRSSTGVVEISAATSALFATGPLAETIEFPDLIGDLALGHVRRRALFQWTFVPRELPRALEPYATLVKYDRSGGAQLPEGHRDFQPLEGAE